jgi:hypothetical protein
LRFGRRSTGGRSGVGFLILRMPSSPRSPPPWTPPSDSEPSCATPAVSCFGRCQSSASWKPSPNTKGRGPSFRMPRHGWLPEETSGVGPSSIGSPDGWFFRREFCRARTGSARHSDTASHAWQGLEPWISLYLSWGHHHCRCDGNSNPHASVGTLASGAPRHRGTASRIAASAVLRLLRGSMICLLLGEHGPAVASHAPKRRPSREAGTIQFNLPQGVGALRRRRRQFGVLPR